MWLMKFIFCNKNNNVMDELIDKLYAIIKDYRKQDGDFMSKEIIEKWINQFDEGDRVFLLTELILILEKRYITRDHFKEYLKTTFFRDIKNVMNEKFGNEDIKQILSRSHFINHQPEGKSQKEIIKLFEEVINDELEMTLADCEKDTPLCFIYLDDILCTGDTIFKGIAEKEGWLNKKTIDKEKTNRMYLEENNIPLFIVFYSIHTFNRFKLDSRIGYAQKGHKIQIWYFWQDEHEIDNNYNDATSKLQYIYPAEDTDLLILNCKKQIEDKIDKYCKENEYKIPESHFFRSKESPKEETLFSSPENRDRFETIILKKSIEIYNKANSSELRMRPLGYGLNTDKSFGYGTLLFSWRNVPFNTPLVFWYEHKGWSPLFQRKWSTYKTPLTKVLEFIRIKPKS